MSTTIALLLVRDGLSNGVIYALLAVAILLVFRVTRLDEPSLGLAPNLIVQIFDWICALRDDGISILLIEQNAFAAIEAAQYAYVRSKGELTAKGDAAAQRNQDEIVSHYFGKRHGSKTAREGTP